MPGEPPPFRIGGPDHLAALVVIAVLVGLVLWQGPRLGPAARRIGRIVLGVVMAGYMVSAYLRLPVAGEMRWDSALPLHVCEITLTACTLAMLLRKQWCFEIAYFWGLAGAFMATLTPNVREGFPAWQYFNFFWVHGGILICLAYLLAAERMQPAPGAVARMMLALNLYVVVVGSLNALFGWNYGFLCRKPRAATLMDYFGPWPWYLVVSEGVALLMFWGLTLPWRWWGKWREPHPEGCSGR